MQYARSVRTIAFERRFYGETVGLRRQGETQGPWNDSELAAVGVRIRAAGGAESAQRTARRGTRGIAQQRSGPAEGAKTASEVVDEWVPCERS